MKTVYIVQGFTRQSSGKKSTLIADTAIACATEYEAINRAERMAEIRAGVIAVSQEYDEDSGDYGKLVILATHGEIPPGAIGEE